MSYKVDSRDQHILLKSLDSLHRSRMELGTMTTGLYRRRDEIDKQIEKLEGEQQKIFEEQEKVTKLTMEKEVEFEATYKTIRDRYVTENNKDAFQYCDETTSFMHIDEIRALRDKQNARAQQAAKIVQAEEKKADPAGTCCKKENEEHSCSEQCDGSCCSKEK